MEFKLLNANEIKHTGTIFNISEINEEDTLSASLKKIGIITPLLCYKIENNFFLIDGFKRMSWALKNNLNNIPIVFTEIDDFQTAFLNFIDFRYENKKNAAMIRAKLIGIARDNFKDDINQELLKRSILSKRKGDEELFEQLIDLPNKLKSYLEKIGASPSQLLPLIRMEATAGEEIISTIAMPLEMNANQLRKTLDYLADIKKQNKVSTTSLTQIVTLGDVTIPERKKLFFKELEKLRFPDTEKHRAKFNKIKKELFGATIKIEDNNFDDKDIDISFRVQSKKELEEKAKIISEVAKKSDNLFNFH